MSYKHLSQTERYQIFALMNAGQNLKTIAQILGRHQSTVSREVLCNSGLRGYRPRQGEILCQQQAQASRNALQIDPVTRKLVADRLNLRWSPEQISASLPVIHETIYQHIYADKAQGGSLWKHFRCQSMRRKHFAIGKSLRGQIIGRSPIAERPTSVNTHVTRKTSDLISQTIVTSLALLSQRVRTLTYGNRKEFADHAVVDEALKSTAYCADPFAS